MNADQQLKIFEAATAWQRREKQRLFARLRAPGQGKHRAWKQLLELATRITQLKREFNRFLETK